MPQLVLENPVVSKNSWKYGSKSYTIDLVKEENGTLNTTSRRLPFLHQRLTSSRKRRNLTGCTFRSASLRKMGEPYIVLLY